MDFICSFCGDTFYQKRYLHGHLSRIHGVKSDKKNAERQVVCAYCEKQFASKKSLSNHVVKFHKVVSKTVACQEVNCSEKFHNVCDLRTHLCSSHEMKGIADCEKLTFEKYEDFLQWLAVEENESNAKFLIQTKKKMENHEYTSFRCNRSGVYKPKVECRKRQLKAQGTMKIGFHCTAAIVVKEFCSHVEVSYYKIHYKHENVLCHVPLPQAEKELIAGKLLQGVAENNILHDIRQSLETSFERKHLTTRKDLQNIKRDFGITLESKGSVIQDDETSVCAWVQKMESEVHNPVLLYKRQDDPHDVIDKKDFMLVLMTNFQRCMLYRLGADRICVDSTHGISNYNFELVTILVIDEYEEGIPVAFCISSSVNTTVLTLFFQCIKTALSADIDAKIFMSDDAPMFKNAWINVFGPCAHYLLCAWHVDRAWRKNLNSLRKEIQSDIYKTLKTLMYELDESNFRNMLRVFCEMLNEDADTKEFYRYFLDNYFSRCEMWAYCFRKGAKINTNMHIENFHRSLKHIYLEGKKTKRVDKVILELMKLVKDKNFDNYIKSQKGKITKRATQNFKRHRDGKNLQATFKQIDENKWEVTSGKKVYNVLKVHACNSTCIIACRNCVLCMKAYTCTCHDYMISNFLCKHIHFILINCSQEQNFCGPLNKPSSIMSVENSGSNITTEAKHTQLEFNKIKMNVLSNKLNSITTMDDIISKQIKNHLVAIEHLLGVKSDSSFPCQRKVTSEPSNKKVIQQKRFYSVKKPRSSKKIKLSNPTSTEIEIKKDVLLKKELIHSSKSDFDHCYFK